jgi:hypothetical protein
VKLTAFPFKVSTKSDWVALLQNLKYNLCDVYSGMRAKCAFKLIGNYISVFEQVIYHTIKLLLEILTPISLPQNLEALF